MDPLEEYNIQKEYNRRLIESQKKSLGFYNLVDESDDIINSAPALNGGNIQTGFDNTEYPILKILPPGYKIVPWYLANRKGGELVGGIIHKLLKLQRPVSKNLYKILGKGFLLTKHKKVYGGFGLDDIKSFIKGAKSDINAIIKNPFDIGGQIAAFLYDILPYMVKYGKQIVENPLDSINIVQNYINDITPYVNKYANKLDKISRGSGFCCTNCAMGKKCKGGCSSCMSGGFSSSILNDPEFIKKLEQRKANVENKLDKVKEMKEILKEDYKKADISHNQEKIMNIENKFEKLDNEEARLLTQLQDINNKNQKLHYFPEDYQNNYESTGYNLPQNILSEDFDIPFEMAKKYIDFVYPSLPDYIRFALSKNLFNSINN